MGKRTASWRDQMKCLQLSPKQADEIFFVKPGGKSKAAETYCSDCPVISKCLQESLILGGPGFWAGTTEPERERMVKFLGLMPNQLENFMPPEPTISSRRLRPIPKKDNIYCDPLWGVDGPSVEEELKMYGM